MRYYNEWIKKDNNLIGRKETTAEKIDDILDSVEKIASKIFILDYKNAA